MCKEAFVVPKLLSQGKEYAEATGLVKTVDKREEFLLLKESDPVLADKLQQLDDLLEELLLPLEKYDKTMNTIYEEDEIDQVSEWGPRIMRCRFVLGCD